MRIANAPNSSRGIIARDETAGDARTYRKTETDDAAIISNHVVRVEVRTNKLVVELAKTKIAGPERKLRPNAIEVPWRLALGYIDMRKGIDGLAMLVQGVLQQDPFTGHLFVFRGRTRANLIKIMHQDGTRYVSLHQTARARRLPVAAEHRNPERRYR